MKKFENHAQFIKYKVVNEIIKSELNGTLKQDLWGIGKIISPGPKSETRCCIYKERAIVGERVNNVVAKFDGNVVNIIDLACDECPINRFTVTEACRGCLAHSCQEHCPVGAIEFINHKSHINQEKCIECGMCKKNCPFDAISDVKRPCKKSCKVDAIEIDPSTRKASIDRSKCINCGACVSKCPFGALVDKSMVLDIIDLIRNSENNTKYKVYCILAPAVAAQYPAASIEQVVQAVKQLGFYDVVEAAIGADIVAEYEAHLLKEELAHKGFVTSSCCPAFVSLIKTKYPELTGNISTAVSPMIATARLIKSTDPTAKVIFIGPCVAKKGEAHQEQFQDDISFVMSFEELQAYLDAADIDVMACEKKPFENASIFGRKFARSGGVTEAVKHIFETEKFDVDLKPVVCNGLDECEKALKLAKLGRLNGNFIEGMACEGGCVNGPVVINRKANNVACINKYGDAAKEKTVTDSIKVFDIDKLDLDVK